MSFATSDTWLVLEGTRLPPGFAALAPQLSTAGGVLQAAVHLARSRPTALVVDSRVAWHDTFVRTLPPGRVPIVAIGGPPSGVTAICLPENASFEECRARLEPLLETARHRPARPPRPDGGSARPAA